MFLLLGNRYVSTFAGDKGNRIILEHFPFFFKNCYVGLEMPYSAIHPTHFVPYQRSHSISGINLLKLEGYFDKTLRKELLLVVRKKSFSSSNIPKYSSIFWSTIFYISLEWQRSSYWTCRPLLKKPPSFTYVSLSRLSVSSPFQVGGQAIQLLFSLVLWYFVIRVYVLPAAPYILWDIITSWIIKTL